MDLIKEKLGEKSSPEFTKTEFGRKQITGDVTFSLEPNGHVLGSAGVHLESDGLTHVVTSDFRYQDSFFFKGTKPIQADTLVIETTFGEPQYVFPKQEEVAANMVTWITKNAKDGLVLLAGYSLGKAQELTYLANQSGFTPVVHESIFKNNTILKCQ